MANCSAQSRNHAPGFTYDGMGNVNVDNLSNNYSYDAEGRPITAAGMATTFDAFGRAWEQSNNGIFYTQIVYSPSGAKFAYMNGQTLIKYIDPMVAGMAAVHFNAGKSMTSGYFQHADWLGSSRFGVTGAGTVQYDRAYAPFGETYFETTTTNRNFTGQTEDTTPGLYDFLFRQQSQSQGRWLVPDPAGLAAVDLTNPQTWNRYAYVGNNPLNAIDPLGLYLCDTYDVDADCNGGGDGWGGGGGGDGGGDGQSTTPPPDYCGPDDCPPVNYPPFQTTGSAPYPSDNNLSTPAQYNGNVGSPGYTNYISFSLNQPGTQIPLNRPDRPDVPIYGIMGGKGSQIIQQVGQTAPQIIHPCSIGLFYAASVIVPFGVAAMPQGATFFPEIAQQLPLLSLRLSRILPYAQRMQQLTGRAAAFVGGAILSGCNSL